MSASKFTSVGKVFPFINWVRCALIALCIQLSHTFGERVCMSMLLNVLFVFVFGFIFILQMSEYDFYVN